MPEGVIRAPRPCSSRISLPVSRIPAGAGEGEASVGYVICPGAMDTGLGDKASRDVIGVSTGSSGGSDSGRGIMGVV